MMAIVYLSEYIQQAEYLCIRTDQTSSSPAILADVATANPASDASNAYLFLAIFAYLPYWLLEYLQRMALVTFPLN